MHKFDVFHEIEDIRNVPKEKHHLCKACISCRRKLVFKGKRYQNNFFFCITFHIFQSTNNNFFWRRKYEKWQL